jgi:hypothetical protein
MLSKVDYSFSQYQAFNFCFILHFEIFPMSIAVKLDTNYGKISRHGTATVLLSKHIRCIAIDKLLDGMEICIFIIKKTCIKTVQSHQLHIEILISFR